MAVSSAHCRDDDGLLDEGQLVPEPSNVWEDTLLVSVDQTLERVSLDRMGVPDWTSSWCWVDWQSNVTRLRWNS